MHRGGATRSGRAPRGRRVVPFAVLACAVVATSGCVVFDLAKVRETEAIERHYAYIAGTVAVHAPDGPTGARPQSGEDGERSEKADWVVVYVATMPCDDDWREMKEAVERGASGNGEAESRSLDPQLVERLRDKLKLADHVVLQGSGFWYVRVAPGCYGVGAFVDADRDFVYDDEPMAPATARPDRIMELGPGDRRDGIDLVIEPDVRMEHRFNPALEQVRRSRFRSHDDQLLVSLAEVTAEGELADLDDPRFGPESGRLGYFDVYRFLWKSRPGIYFLEEYDPDRIPVLFVHGARGFPQSFRSLIEGLDRSRFQPWVALYPSGSRLASVAEYLSRNIATLQLRHDFDEMAVVAHSMGGLVARDFILRHDAKFADHPVKLFVSISTPWAGIASAAAGVERSPFVVPSWRDVDPNSHFLAQLFFSDPERRTVARPLPEEVAHYLIFGVEDTTVSIPSEVRWEAARGARERWPLVYDHTAILDGPETSQLLDEMLDRELP
jgi:pimeloyl-ACP methyl ester carboxylesterase